MAWGGEAEDAFDVWVESYQGGSGAVGLGVRDEHRLGVIGCVCCVRCGFSMPEFGVAVWMLKVWNTYSRVCDMHRGRPVRHGCLDLLFHERRMSQSGVDAMVGPSAAFGGDERCFPELVERLNQTPAWAFLTIVYNAWGEV